MSNLILHAGAKAITREQIAQLPEPEILGPRHNPLPFITDIELVTQELGRNGLHVVEEAFGVLFNKVTNAPERYFGIMELKHNRTDHALVVGVRGSYDQSISRGLAVGSRVFVCDNLAFSGEVTFSTKQTTNIGERLPRMIALAAQKVPVLADLQTQRFDTYRHVELKPRHGDAALVELFRREVLNSQTMARAVSEWDEPSHPEHAEDGYSVWRLHNAVTEAIKAKDPDRPNVLPVWDRTIKLTRFLDEVSGLQ
jgi:hypothetical protein